MKPFALFVVWISVLPGRLVPAETKAETLAYLREGYDVVAKAEHPVSAALRLMSQSLLADRFCAGVAS